MKLNSKQIREQIEEAKSLPTTLLETTDYLRLFDREQSLPESQLQERLAQISRDYRRSRTYWHTEEELATCRRSKMRDLSTKTEG